MSYLLPILAFLFAVLAETWLESKLGITRPPATDFERLFGRSPHNGYLLGALGGVWVAQQVDVEPMIAGTAAAFVLAGIYTARMLRMKRPE